MSNSLIKVKNRSEKLFIDWQNAVREFYEQMNGIVRYEVIRGKLLQVDISGNNQHFKIMLPNNERNNKGLDNFLDELHEL